MKTFSLMFFALLIATSLTSFSQVPQKISYQGLLTTGTGAPVADGSYDLKFEIFTLPSGGTLRHSETHAGVSVQRGTFSLALGPLPAIFSESLYVEVTALAGPGIASPLTFSPRAELTSAPYSLAPWTTNGTSISYGGNVGIGNESPVFPLSFNNTTGDKICLWGQSANHYGLGIGSYQLQIHTDGAPSDIVFGYGNSASITEQMRIKGSGNVGIGTAFPQKMLSVAGGMNLDQSNLNSGTVTNALTFGSSSGEGIASKRTAGGNQYGLDFYTASSNRMSILNIGYVGIGTTSPSFPLHVFSTSSKTAETDNGSTSGDGFGLIGRADGIGGYQHIGLAGYGSGAGTFNVGVYGNATDATSYAGFFAGNLAYTGSLINASDVRFKEDIQEYSGALASIKQLKPRTFTFKSGEEYGGFNFSAGKHYGFVAQELERVFPELVVTTAQPPERDSNGIPTGGPLDYKGINTMELIPILLQGMQEQQKLIEELQARVARLEKE